MQRRAWAARRLARDPSRRTRVDRRHDLVHADPRPSTSSRERYTMVGPLTAFLPSRRHAARATSRATSRAAGTPARPSAERTASTTASASTCAATVPARPRPASCLRRPSPGRRPCLRRTSCGPGRCARASPSWAICAILVACSLVMTASVATTPRVVFSPGARKAASCSCRDGRRGRSVRRRHAPRRRPRRSRARSHRRRR